jgi:hypothetical protein
MMSTGKRDIYRPVDEYETLSRWSTAALVSSMVSYASLNHTRWGLNRFICRVSNMKHASPSDVTSHVFIYSPPRSTP